MNGSVQLSLIIFPGKLEAAETTFQTLCAVAVAITISFFSKKKKKKLPCSQNFKVTSYFQKFRVVQTVLDRFSLFFCVCVICFASIRLSSIVLRLNMF